MITVPTELTALVTGCLGAIGRAICDELWHQGYRVVGTDRRPHHDSRATTISAIWPMQRQHANVPMARMGEPSEIARVVSFLASPAAAYLNGSIVDVDVDVNVNGGWIC